MIKYFLEDLKRQGMTQMEIAAKAGINQSLICKLMQGGDCNTQTLVKIARAFNVSTDTVLGLDKPDPPLKSNSMSPNLEAGINNNGRPNAINKRI